MNEMNKMFNEYIKILKDITGNNVIITDRDKIVACPENKNEEL